MRRTLINLIMKVKKGFVLHEICNENVVIAEGIENIDFNNLISMNDTAAYIWKNVQGKDFSVEDMVSMILSEYDIDEETAKNDCKALAENWLNAGICEE